MIGVKMLIQIKNGVDYKTLINQPDMQKISLNTYKKYDNMDLFAATDYIMKRHRKSGFDECFLYIDEVLRDSPKISSQELLDMIQEKYPDITQGVRALQIYLKPLREELKRVKQRVYRSVETTPEDNQVQVDNGECVVRMNGSYVKVYFATFIHSYSRRMFAYFQDRPFNTDDFIKAHEESIKFFGGSGKEYVYDQTKLVVLKERYGEVLFNKKFEQFAIKSEFKIRVCHAYDPESKGKVERAIRFIKYSFLYHRTFIDINDLQQKFIEWIIKKDTRIHGTTKEKPADRFVEEKKYLNTNYFFFDAKNIRTVDKTGLINYNTNKYSVPSDYHCKKVIINEIEYKLYIYDSKSYKLIAQHQVSTGKQQRIIDPNHYPNKEEKTINLTHKAIETFVQISGGVEIIERVKSDNPDIQRSQLQGLITLASKYSKECWVYSMSCINDLPRTSYGIIEKILKESQFKMVTSGMPEATIGHVSACSVTQAIVSSSCLDRSLNTYMKGVKNVKNNDNKFEKK